MSDGQQTMNNDVTRAVPGGAGRAELEPGTRLGRYEVLRLLGRGGMGQVYLARHELQKTLHALKILPSEFSGRAGFVERFRTELQTMARLQHPNIVHVQYSDVEAGLYYLVMDFVAADGTEEPYDLEEALAIEKRLEPEIVRRLMLRLCDGLSFAHGKGVVHRDLKPANILLTSKDLSAADVKICDFGLARVVGEEQVRTMVAQSMQRSMSIGDQDTFTEKKRSERSSTGSVMGTYGYMSPEQEEGKPADERSDLYALGVMMYRMITGQRLRGMAKPASQVVPGLDPAWDAIIGKCLENDPAARWQTAAELKASLAGGRVAVGSSSRQWNQAALWLVGAAVAVALGYGAYRMYATYRVEMERDRAASEQTAKLDAAQREKVAGLEAAAEAALAAGDLEKAGTKITELGQLGGTRVGVSELRKRYEAKAGEREVNKRYAAASLAREEAQKLNPGQGFGEKIKALETTWCEAEAARQSQGWGQAQTGYDAVLASCKALGELDVSRRGAEARRGEADKAKSDAEQAQSATDAADLYAAGGRGCARAAETFEKGEFDAAGKDWQEAVSAYTSARKNAVAAQDCRKVKASFESALARDRALLEKHGGAKWAEVQKQQKAAEVSSADPAEASRAYGLALAALPGAVTEAKAAEQDRLAKEKGDAEAKAAEQDRLAKEKGEAEAEQRRQASERKTREEKESRDLAEAAYTAWAAKAQPLAERLGRDITSVKGAAAKALLAETDAILIGTDKLDITYLTSASVSGLKALQTKLQSLKVGIKIGFEPGDTETVDLGSGVKIELAWCPAGSFMMGSPSTEANRESDESQHRVTLTKSFWLGRTEVTQAQWEAIMGSNPSKFKGSDLPVETVSWDDCLAFIRKLNGKLETGNLNFRLPTEAEWEYACRAGSTGPYAGTLEEMGWYFSNSGNTIHAVGRKCANAWGLYDMHGNVWEWCQDWYAEYPAGSVTDPEGPASGAGRVRRSGGWNMSKGNCRSADRNRPGPGIQIIYVGFRLARNASIDEPSTADAKTEQQMQHENREDGKEPVDGQAWVSPSSGMEFVWIPALKIWVGKYEVTNGEYRKKEAAHDSKDYKGNSLNGDRQPVVQVNFDDAKAYAAWLTEKDREKLGGKRYRVISEMEWQTVAQCGDNREYPWGNALQPKYGNYYKTDAYDDGFVVTCPVEQSGKNDWGLYGIGGNVWESCAMDVSGSSFGAWRGASWGYDYPDVLRCAARDGGGGSGRSYFYGFRLVLSGNQRSDVDEISSCVSLIRNALYKAWKQPKQSEAGSRPAKLYIRLDASGRFVNYRITQSSGSTIFDTSVLKAAANCPPVRDVTAGFLKKHDELTIEFRLE